jgi:phosphoenolpyruvate synthase/pyruvate phosphate dikinase
LKKLLFMKYITPLSEANDNSFAGGKATALAKLITDGFNVPDGFVVQSNAFQEFIGTKKISNQLKKEIKEAFKKLNCKKVAVRSSATAEDSRKHSWAGQLETYLNTTEAKLIENIIKCWTSLFSERANVYRKTNKLIVSEISVAVIVQKMVASEKSGIIFTANPVTNSKNQIIIEAGNGLGENIVSGRITPDNYVVEKQSIKILEKNLSKGKAILEDKEIKELARIAIKIEKLFKYPVDIEWTIEKKKTYILQARPITTLY